MDKEWIKLFLERENLLEFEYEYRSLKYNVIQLIQAIENKDEKGIEVIIRYMKWGFNLPS